MNKWQNCLRLVFALLLAAFCTDCTPAQHDIVHPQPDQVLFFERPLTLAAARRSEVPSPVIVLLEHDPWATVIGADSPTFALYEDGTVIQRTASGFSTARLSEEARKRLVERLNLPALSRSYGRFMAARATDQPEQDLLIYVGAKPIFVSIDGSLKDREIRSRVPREVVAAYDTLVSARPARSRTWLPDYVEVMVWPFDHALRSIGWPAGWASLDDPLTIKRGEDSFSIFMPSTQLAAILAFQKQKGESAVEIDGRKWSMSVRFPFPHEKLWMAPNPELDQTKR